jgi:glycosyltransferase EpsF
MDDRIKRVLHIVSSMDRGGAETLIMNVYRNIDRGKVQFDFLAHNEKKGDFEDEIVQLGGRIFKILSLGSLGPISYVKELKKIMTENKFDVVHIHTDFQGGFPALAAKLSGIKTRICHSHSTNWPRSNGFLNRTVLKTLKTLIRFSSTNYCSCSAEAAHFLFGKTSKVQLLKNGIDLNQFTRMPNLERTQFLIELGLPKDAVIIGHIGRFSSSKNQTFILKILKQILNDDERFFAVLIGDGPLKKQIEEKALKLGIRDHVHFLGVRDDIPNLIRQFDVFLFPSLFEGFGIVTIEAQSAGIPCVVSDTVPKSTDMGLNLVSFISLEESVDFWCKKVVDALNVERPAKRAIIEKISQSGYSIQNNMNEWLELYGAS